MIAVVLLTMESGEQDVLLGVLIVLQKQSFRY